MEEKGSQKMVVVDAEGKPTGKIALRSEAHKSPGMKHLAIQVLLFNGKTELILHYRHGRKIGGNVLDAPTTHVLADETPDDAAWRCIRDEYSIKEKIPLKILGGFSYEKDYGDGTCENEYCLVAKADYSGKIKLNEKEAVGGIILMPFGQAKKEVKENPKKFPVWFLKSFEIAEKSSSI